MSDLDSFLKIKSALQGKTDLEEWQTAKEIGVHESSIRAFFNDGVLDRQRRYTGSNRSPFEYKWIGFKADADN